VLIEMLAGCSPVAGVNDHRQLLEVRRNLPARLPELLPAEVVRCELLLSFIRGMIAPDPVLRFPSAEAADLLKEGAAAFQRQLVIGDLAAEYPNEIREWLDELKGMEAQDVARNLSSW
jgi:serine/threonine-protein kinase